MAMEANQDGTIDVLDASDAATAAAAAGSEPAAGTGSPDDPSARTQGTAMNQGGTLDVLTVGDAAAAVGEPAAAESDPGAPRGARLRSTIMRLLYQRWLVSRERTMPAGAVGEAAAAEEERAVRSATAAELAAGAACRFCFESSAPLVAVCACTGSQQWVHVGCLRRWQRASLTSPNSARCSVCTVPFALKSKLPPGAPQVGSLLVASPELSGTFARTVVLLTHASAGGVTGVILNKPSDTPCVPPDLLSRVERDAASRGTRVAWHRGGPVCGGRLGVVSFAALHTLDGPRPAGWPPPAASSSVLLSEGGGGGRSVSVALDADGDGRAPATIRAADLPAAVSRLARQGGSDTKAVLLYLGFARWGRGQLAMEYGERRWGSRPATVADVLDVPAAELWQRCRDDPSLVHARGDGDAGGDGDE